MINNVEVCKQARPRFIPWRSWLSIPRKTVKTGGQHSIVRTLRLILTIPEQAANSRTAGPWSQRWRTH